MKTAFKLALLTASVALTTNLLALDAGMERTGDGKLNITWDSKQPVDVWLYYGREGGDAKQLVSDDDSDGSHQLQLSGMERPYVLLRDSAGNDVVVAERLLPLEGGRNFRDLGGYETSDGRRVKWGMLYRSGTMVGLTAKDYEFLDTLGIATVCDFRSTEEREDEPTRWQTDPQPTRHEQDYELDLGFMAAMMNDPNITADEARAQFADFYRDAPRMYASHYRNMFAQLIAGKAPLAFNCSAGKDRTGVASALLLTALGVPRAQVIADYELTNRYFEMPKEPIPGSTTAQMLAALSPDVVAVMGSAEGMYIEAVFTELESHYGSVEAFLEQELEVDAADRAKLRELYTE